MANTNLDLEMLGDQTKALISKLHAPMEKTKHAEEEEIIEVLKDKKSQESINRDTLTLFPEIEVAGEVATALILSPKDKMDHDISFAMVDNNLPNTLNQASLSLIKKYLEDNYDLNGDLYDTCHRAYFKYGAVFKLIIPESTLDDLTSGRILNDESALKSLIGRSNENLTPIGILKKEDKKNKDNGISTAMEFLTANIDDKYGISKTKTRITDDYKSVLASEKAIKIREDVVLESLSAFDFYGKADTESSIYKNVYRDSTPNNVATNYISLKNLNTRENIGKPLELDVPIENILPVHSPGNPSDHLGYYMITSGETFLGTDVTSSSNKDDINEISERTISMFSKDDNEDKVSNSVTAKLNQMVKDKNMLPSLVDTFSHHMETDLIDKLVGGIYKDNVVVSDNRRFYLLMLYRVLNKMDTKVIFIPVEMGQYFAMNYHKNGTGKSVLEALSVISSLRSILLLTKINRQVASSVINTKVDVEIDEFDMDADNTRDSIITEIMKMREDNLPIGETGLTNLSDWLVRQGIQINFAEHPRLPNTKFDFSREEVTLPDLSDDSDQEERLRKQAILKTGIVPEMMDSGTDVDFASISDTTKQMVLKKFSRLRKLLLKHETEYVQKLLLHDGDFKLKLVELIESEKSGIFADIKDIKKVYNESPKLFYNEVLKLIIHSLSVRLPYPDSSSMTILKEEYELYVEAIDEVLEIYYTEDMAINMALEDSDDLDTHKQSTRGYLLRQWCSTNGYLPELASILEKEGENKFTNDNADEMLLHISDMAKSILYFKKKKKKIQGRLTKAMEKMDEEPPEEEEAVIEPVDDVVVEDTETEDGVIDEDIVPDESGEEDLTTEEENKDDVTDDAAEEGETEKVEEGTEEETEDDLGENGLPGLEIPAEESVNGTVKISDL